MNSEAGKGDTYRRVDRIMYETNWSRVFGPECVKIVVPLELEAVIDAVIGERMRQRTKWGTQKHEHGRWALILGEEFGEVCEAALEGTPNLYNELIQVAAVALEWAQQIQTGKAV